MEKIIISVLIAILATVEIALAASGVLKDNKAPEIHIYQEKILYEIGCDDEVILKGIVALDDKDNDVSETVELVSRNTIVEGQIEAVGISACDKSGNVMTSKVIFVVEEDGTFKILDYSNYIVDMDTMKYTVKGTSVTGTLKDYETIR